MRYFNFIEAADSPNPRVSALNANDILERVQEDKPTEGASEDWV